MPEPMTLKGLEDRWNNPQTLWDAWIALMASGRFKKGKGYLIRDSCYCALGVLVEASGYPGQSSDKHHGAISFDGLHSSVPTALARFMNMGSMGDLKDGVTVARTLVPLVKLEVKSIAGLSDASGDEWPLARLAPVIDAQRKNLLSFGIF